VLNTNTRSYNTAGYTELQSARPVPSPVHRYNASTSRRRSCCSPKSSSRRPLTWARAERMTLRKFLYRFFLVSMMPSFRVKYGRSTHLILCTECGDASFMRSDDRLACFDDIGICSALEFIGYEKEQETALQ
jgi:hypothetical protein